MGPGLSLGKEPNGGCCGSYRYIFYKPSPGPKRCPDHFKCDFWSLLVFSPPGFHSEACRDQGRMCTASVSVKVFSDLTGAQLQSG